MTQLLRLELAKSKSKRYTVILLLVTLIITGFLYMIAVIANSEHDPVFNCYSNVLRLHTSLVFLTFCVLSILLYSNFILDDYTAERSILLFSYPVSRTKLFLSKLLLVNLYLTGGLLLATIFPSGLFLITEKIYPIINDKITFQLIGSELDNILNTIFAIITVGLISLRLSLMRKSIHISIVVTLLLSMILGNVLISIPATVGKTIAFLMLFLVGLGFAYSTNSQIKKMEV